MNYVDLLLTVEGLRDFMVEERGRWVEARVGVRRPDGRGGSNEVGRIFLQKVMGEDDGVEEGGGDGECAGWKPDATTF